MASSGCPNWEKNYLHAWGYWPFNKSCGTNWKYSASNYDGSRINCAYGSIMVGAFVYSNMFVIIYFMFFWKNDSMKCFSRSDPTENDSVEGLRPNARGPGLVTFGVSDFYLVFCKMVIILFFFLENDINRFKIWYF